MFNFGLFARSGVRVVLASQLNECGLASLACVADFYDGSVGLQDIRQLANHSGRGESLLALRDIAERVGLTARGIQADLSSLKQVQKPAILHWEMNHFVVLERADSKGVTIMDPAAGRMRFKWAEVSSRYTGFALELIPGPRWQKSPRTNGGNFRNLLRPLSQWRLEVSCIIILSVLLEIFALIMPMQVQIMVDAAVVAADVELVWTVAFGFAALALIRMSTSCIRAWMLALFSARVGFKLKSDFAVALHAKPPEFFLHHNSSDLFSRSKSVDALQTLVSAQLVQAVIDMAMFLVLLAVLMILVPVLGTILVGFTLVGLTATLIIRAEAVNIAGRSLRASAKADSLFIENIRAAKAIRIFGREGARIALWRNRQTELVNLLLSDNRLGIYSAQLLQFMNVLSTVTLVAVGAHLVISKSLTLGGLMMFLLLKSQLAERLTGSMNYLAELKRLKPNADRVIEIAANETNEAPLRVGQSLSNAEQVDICFKDVWFRYGDDSPWILKGVNLHVRAGESVAITGPSGCGKTTLLQLATAMLAPVRGEVLINDINIQHIDRNCLAQAVGVVAQDDILFGGTVADNISFFDAPVDTQALEDAACRANILDDIQALPMQFMAMIAEAGSNLSGGQRQRIFIARALYRKPRMLFLDEATSHLDERSERLVSAAISSLQVTRLLIAHRLETIRTADVVYDFIDGQLTKRVKTAA